MKFRLLLVLIVVSLAFSAQADASYISIQEMQNDVPATWTETLTGGKDIECTIDAVIVVPDVDRFPILQATWQGEMEGLDPNLVIEENSEKHVFVKTLPDNVTDTWQKGVKTETLVTCESEMDPETVRQADEKAEKMLRENMEALDRIADFLIEKETITGEQFMSILNEIKNPPAPAEDTENVEDAVTV